MTNIRDDIIPGLCAACKHMARIETRRGSIFVMCNLSRTDPSFRKYPMLPVVSCRGFSEIERSPESRRGNDDYGGEEIKYSSLL